MNFEISLGISSILLTDIISMKNFYDLKISDYFYQLITQIPSSSL